MEWEFKMAFIDERVITIEADTEDEARAKMDSGDFASEHTEDFYSYELLQDLRPVEEN